MYPTTLSTMKRRFTCDIFLPPFTIILQIAVIVGIALILRAGSFLPDLYFALVDAHDYTRKVGSETFTGLPDSHDFSKYKDFFKLYPGLYCSGGINNGKYDANFCSTWGKQLFDQQGVWRVWGVHLMDKTIIGDTPKVIFIGLLAVAGTGLLSVLLGLLSFCIPYWVASLATIVFWLSALVMVAVAVFSHVAISQLITAASNLEATGTGTIVVKRGDWFDRAMWIACSISVLAAIFWTIVAWRKRKLRASRKHGRIPLRSGNIIFGPNTRGSTASYEQLVGGQESYHKGSVTQRESAYEPMRHHPGGYQ